MALVIGIDAYTDVTSLKAWADKRLYDYAAYTDLQIEAAIVISNIDYIEANYKFLGEAVDDTQPLQLPTDDVAIADIENAANQAAWQQLQGKLFVSESELPSVEVESESSKLGDLSESVTYKSGSRKKYTYDTSRIDRLLKPYLSRASLGLGIYNV